MATCHDMKEGDVYICDACGLEMQVIKECNEAGISAEDCRHDDKGDDHCVFCCCGQELTKK